MNIQNSAIDPDQSSSAPMAEPHDFDLRRIFVIFRRRFRLMLVVGAVVFLAAAVITMLMTPLYTATSRVMINTRKEDVVNTQAVMSGLTLDTSVTDTEVEVLRSRQLTERVSAAMNLDTDPEFNKTLKPPTPVSTSIAAVRSTLKKLLPPKPISAEQAAIQAHQKIIDNLLGNLSVKRSGTTYVIDIAFTSEMPGKAAKIANKYAELYMLQQLQTKFDAGKQATGWLNDRLTELRAQVQADDAALQNYRVNNNLMSTNAMGLTEQEITSDNLQVASARGQAAEDRARLEAAKAQRGRGEEVGEATNSEVIRNLRAQRSTLSAKVAELSGTFGPKHPALITAQRQLDDVDAAIKLEVGRVIAKLEAQSKASQDRLASLQASAGKAQGTLANSNRAMVRFNDLQRNADASKTLYESYLNRFKETSSVQGIEKADANVVSMAQTPTRPSSPKLMIGLALGVAMAGLCALAALILAENLDAGLSTSSDVERRLRFRYLAGIPSVDSVSKKKNVAPADYIVQNPLSSFAEAFRNLRAAVQHAPIS